MSSPASSLLNRSVKKVEMLCLDLLTRDELKEYCYTVGELHLLFEAWFNVKNIGEDELGGCLALPAEDTLKEMKIMLNARRRYTDTCEDIWEDLCDYPDDHTFNKVYCDAVGSHYQKDIPSYYYDIYHLSHLTQSDFGVMYVSPTQDFVVALIAEKVAEYICSYLSERIDDKLREIRDIRQLKESD
jgi:hypothetical protein